MEKSVVAELEDIRLQLVPLEQVKILKLMIIVPWTSANYAIKRGDAKHRDVRKLLDSMIKNQAHAPTSRLSIERNALKARLNADTCPFSLSRVSAYGSS